MSARAKLSVSVDQVQRHIEFLKRVHDDALNQSSALYFNHTILGAAVTRCMHVNCLLHPACCSTAFSAHCLSSVR